jgi:hypothetical protein
MAKEKIILTGADKNLAKKIAKFKEIAVSEVKSYMRNPELRDDFLNKTKDELIAIFEATQDILNAYKPVESSWNSIPDSEFANVIESVVDEMEKEKYK